MPIKVTVLQAETTEVAVRRVRRPAWQQFLYY